MKIKTILKKNSYSFEDHSRLFQKLCTPISCDINYFQLHDIECIEILHVMLQFTLFDNNNNDDDDDDNDDDSDDDDYNNDEDDDDDDSPAGLHPQAH